MKILTFDIEDWFHILDNDSTRSSRQWNSFESRIHMNMERIFDILRRTQTKATFFCLGWIAKTYPGVIRDIANRGFDVASHSHLHQLIYQQKPHEFARDLEYSLKILEDITGKKVNYFRAPGFSIRETNKWAFEIIASMGILVDCSVFPAPRAHGGYTAYNKPVPSIIKYNGIELKELPINYISVFGKPVIFTGGGYFRFFPYYLISNWTKQSDYLMSYLHPRDFDPDQPVIKELTLTRKFKSYTGLKGAAAKLELWLTEFEFTDVATATNNINWSKVPIVNI
ncbi:MAG: polysaccharide deacetylase family protein [Bacteroidales bacterium]